MADFSSNGFLSKEVFLLLFKFLFIDLTAGITLFQDVEGPGGRVDSPAARMALRALHEPFDEEYQPHDDENPEYDHENPSEPAHAPIAQNPNDLK